MCLTVCGTQKSSANKSDRIERVNIAPHAPDSFLLILSIFEIHPSLCHFVMNLPSDKSLLCHEVYDLRLHVAQEECFLSFFIRFFSKEGREGGSSCSDKFCFEAASIKDFLELTKRRCTMR